MPILSKPSSAESVRCHREEVNRRFSSRWQAGLAVGEEVVIQRLGHLGDVLLSTVVADRIKQMRPDVKVCLVTSDLQAQSLLSTHASCSVYGNENLTGVPVDIILDGVQGGEESLANQFLKVAGFPPLNRGSLTIFLREEELSEAVELLSPYEKPWIACGMRAQSMSRTPPEWVWDGIANEWGSGTLIALGSPGESRWAPRRMCNLIGQTGIRQAAAIIAVSDLFIGADSGLVHVAQGLSKPIVVLEMSIGAHARLVPGTLALAIRSYNVDCQPCGKNYCSRSHDAPPCGELLSGDVVSAGLSLIGKCK